MKHDRRQANKKVWRERAALPYSGSLLTMARIAFYVFDSEHRLDTSIFEDVKNFVWEPIICAWPGSIFPDPLRRRLLPISEDYEWFVSCGFSLDL